MLDEYGTVGVQWLAEFIAYFESLDVEAILLNTLILLTVECCVDDVFININISHSSVTLFIGFASNGRLTALVLLLILVILKLEIDLLPRFNNNVRFVIVENEVSKKFYGFSLEK